MAENLETCMPLYLSRSPRSLHVHLLNPRGEQILRQEYSWQMGGKLYYCTEELLVDYRRADRERDDRRQIEKERSRRHRDRSEER